MKYIIGSSGEEVAQLPNYATLLLTPEGTEVSVSSPPASASTIFVYLNVDSAFASQAAAQALVKHISALNSYHVPDHINLCKEKSKQLSSKLTGVSINAEEIVSNVRFLNFFELLFFNTIHILVTICQCPTHPEETQTRSKLQNFI